MDVLHEDILVLILNYLHHKGLHQSVLLVQEEAGIDTAWLCGPNLMVAQLRRSIFNGEYDLAFELLSPLRHAQKSVYDSMALSLLSHAFYAACMSNEPPQIRSKWVQRLAIIALSHAAAIQHLIYANDVKNACKAKFATWDLHLERLRCFQEMVSYLRDVQDDVLRYTAAPPLHLLTLLGQAMAYQEMQSNPNGRQHPEASLALETETNKAKVWDCFASTWTSLERDATSALYLVDPEEGVASQAGQEILATPITRRSLPTRHIPEWPRLIESDSEWTATSQRPVVQLQDCDTQTDTAMTCHQASQTKSSATTATTTQTNALPTLRHQLVQASLAVDLQDHHTQTIPVQSQHVPVQTAAVTTESWPTQTTAADVTHTECQTVELVPKSRRVNAERELVSTSHSNIPNNQGDADNTEPRPSWKEQNFASSTYLEEPEDSDDDVDEGLDNDLEHFSPITTPAATVQPLDVGSAQGKKVDIHTKEATPSTISQRNDMIRLSAGWSHVDKARPLQIQPPPDIANAFPGSSIIPLMQGPAKTNRPPPMSRPAAPETTSAWPEVSPFPKPTRQSHMPPQIPKPQPQPLSVGTVLGFTKQDAYVGQCQAHVIAEAKESQAIRAISISHSGKYIAVGTNARVLRVLNIHDAVGKASGHPLATRQLLPVVSEHYKHHSGPIYCLAWHPRDALLASGSSDSTIHIVKPFVLDGAPMVLTGHQGKVRAVQFCPHNGHILGSVGSGDTLVRVWDVRTAPVSPIMEMSGHGGELTSMEFTRERDECVTGSQDRTVRIWDLRSATSQATLHASSPVQAVACHPLKSDWIASGQSDGSCVIWDRRRAAAPLARLRHHASECRVVTWSPSDPKLLLTAAFDGATCVVNDQWKVLGTFQENNDMILQGRWHSSVPAFATSGGDKTLKLWKLT